MKNLLASALLVLSLLALLVPSEGKKKHHYADGEVIPFYVNNVGPYSNPTETYLYYSLPFCKREKTIKKDLKLGEIIQGDRSVLSDYELPFKGTFICAVRDVFFV